jgi:NAD(P)-dependent dehydrogenase (short-subunit alcohol dehydrogenase family)
VTAQRPFDGKTALVTGASRGIGLAIAHALSADGARVVRVSRSLTRAVTPEWVDLPCDLADPAAVEGLPARVKEAAGVPDLVVNNAGSFLLAPFEETTPAAFAEQIAANLTVPFLVSRAFLPAMRARKSGRLIMVGSIADHVALPGNAAYAAAKYGARGLHQVLREELRGSGVLCSLVSPGPTDTSAWDPVDPDSREGFIPRARMLRPGNVAEAVRWIAGLPGHVDVDWLRLGPA